MNPQVEKLVAMIRDRLASHEGPEGAAAAILAEFDFFDKEFDATMHRNLDEAAKVVRNSFENVVILRRNSLIQNREEWYQGPSASSHHWNALNAYLRNTKDWGEHAVESIDVSSNEVVSLLENPTREDFSCRGLVVGYVQSGKTANMTAVIAKAVDAGYNLVIVLGGVTNKLRAQTQGRMLKDIVSRHRHLWQLYTTVDENGDFTVPANGSFTMPHEGHAQMIVMKKEGSRLRALLRTIKNTASATRRQLKVLMIDDECDQASVNSARDDYDMTRINGEIRKVLAELPAVSYVGYTATPFANVFINPFPHNIDELDDLYPRDFITALPRPLEYFGTREVFGEDDASSTNQGRDMVRIVPDEDPDSLRPTRNADKESFRPEVTDSLADAILWFLATCAIRRSRRHNEEHMTMLIHVSQYVAQHDAMAALVRSWIKDIRPELLGRSGAAWRRFADLVELERQRTAPSGMDIIPETLEDIHQHLPDVFDALDYAVENGTSEMRLDYENGPKTYIAIGGTVLARGLTLEGLVVSFFLRTSRQYDTLLQMGRWFGYRGGYDDLPRLWTTEELASRFRALATIEEEIREDITLYRKHKQTPMQFAVKVRSIPGMAITSATKMKHAFRTSISFDGKHVQTIRFDHLNADIVRGNWSAASALLEQAASETSVIKRDEHRLMERVSFAAVRRFLLDTFISDEHMDLRKDLLLSYVDRLSERLSHWNVGLIQPVAETRSDRPLRPLNEFGHVKTLKRSKLVSRSKKYADIKALMSKRDILIDVDPKNRPAPSERMQWNDLKELRPSVPLLLLYPIDAQSPPLRKTGNREALAAVGDLIGFGIVFPGSPDRSGNYFAVELDAPAPEDMEDDDLAEIGEETNAPI